MNLFTGKEKIKLKDNFYESDNETPTPPFIIVLFFVFFIRHGDVFGKFMLTFGFGASINHIDRSAPKHNST